MSLALTVVERVGLDFQAITDELYKTDERCFYANIVFNLTNGGGRVGQVNIFGSTGQYNGNQELKFVASVDPVIQSGANASDFCYPKPGWLCSTCDCKL